jgi:DnaK suppressor protein
MNHYSKQELDEFKGIIERKLADANEEYRQLVQQMQELQHNGTGDTDSSYLTSDDVNGSIAKEEMNQIAGRLKKFMDGLQAALLRIENGSYGVCRVTGKLIPKERLLAVPHTTLSIDAKMAMRA